MADATAVVLWYTPTKGLVISSPPSIKTLTAILTQGCHQEYTGEQHVGASNTVEMRERND